MIEETLYAPRPKASPVSDPESSGSMKALIEAIEEAQARLPQTDALQRATFQIEKAWRGAVSGQEITVLAELHNDDTGHHSVLSAGDSYLVFAFERKDNEALFIPLRCASRENTKETSSKIRVLDALTKKSGEH